MSCISPMGNTRKVKKLTGLGTPPERLLLGLARSSKAKNVGIFIYSDNTAYKNGQNLSEYITEHNLGEIQKTTQFKNPNNRNTIQAWMWIVNWTNLTNWASTKSETDPYERIY